MTPKELFEKLEFTGNDYSFFKKSKKYIRFSTSGWSENEELIDELRKETVFYLYLTKWETGGHYTFKIPHKNMWNVDYIPLLQTTRKT